MADEFTEISTTGFLDRIVQSLVQVLFGLLLFIGSFIVLWRNEGNVLEEKGALSEIAKAMISGNVDHPKPANDGKILLLSGDLTSDQQLDDHEYLRPGPWLKLARSAEMYQWIESVHTSQAKHLGGGKTMTKTYSYELKWAPGRADSTHFHEPDTHHNPELKARGGDWSVSKASFGAYDGRSLLSHIASSDYTHLAVTEETIEKKPEVTTKQGYLYLQNHPQDKVGDSRLSYTTLSSGPYTVVAQQRQKNTLVEFVTTNDRSKFLIEKGHHAGPAMIKTAKDSAKNTALLLRLVGFALMWFGLTLVMSPLKTLLDVVPFLGDLGSIAVGIVTFVVAAVLSSVTILLGMILHQPLLLTLVILASLAALVYAWATHGRRHHNQAL